MQKNKEEKISMMTYTVTMSSFKLIFYTHTLALGAEEEDCPS